MVVDDHPDTADSLVLLLTWYGFDARPAYDGAAALASAAADPPDVMLVDLRMPGTDGWAVAAAVGRWAGRRPALFAVSVGDLDADAGRLTAAGFARWFEKPFDPDAVAAAVAEVAAGRRDPAGV